MGLTHFKHWFPLLAVLLTACATSTPVVHEGDEAPDAVYSWEEARSDPSCVVPLCDEERCAVWRCRDVVEVEVSRAVDAPAVVLTKGTYPVVVRPLTRPVLRPSTDTRETTAVREPWEPRIDPKSGGEALKMRGANPDILRQRGSIPPDGA